MNESLRAKSIPGVAVVDEGPGGLEVLTVTASVAEARIFLHGAQLTHWQPRGSEPVIFTSQQSAYRLGTAIRGGIPVCLPWFGPRDEAPAHGFLRNRLWELEALEQAGDGDVQARFIARADDATLAIWPHEFAARLTYTIGATLQMDLEMENNSAEGFTFSEALHTYFAVGDARQSRVEGLDGALYRDFPDRSQLSTQQGPIVFSEEIDRVYVNTGATCVLVDPLLDRCIAVEKSGSNSTVVWNPWTAKAAAMADLGDDEWPGMVCIETANAFENSITLPPGTSHQMKVRISVTEKTVPVPN